MGFLVHLDKIMGGLMQFKLWRMTSYILCYAVLSITRLWLPYAHKRWMRGHTSGTSSYARTLHQCLDGCLPLTNSGCLYALRDGLPIDVGTLILQQLRERLMGRMRHNSLIIPSMIFYFFRKVGVHVDFDRDVMFQHSNLNLIYINKVRTHRGYLSFPDPTVLL